MIKPFSPYKIDSKFKQQVSYGVHEGWDMNGLGGGNTDCGTEYLAPGDCVVVYSGNSTKDYGNMVVLEFKTNNGLRWVRFGHCDKVMVKTGDKLKEGVTFATMGTTGNSTACHLHLDVFKVKPSSWRFYGGKEIDKWFEDPDIFFKSTVVSDTMNDMPTWFSGLLQENNIPQESAEGRIREIFDQAKKYETAQKERDRALRDLAEARGDSTKYEELFANATRENSRLTKEINDLRLSMVERDKELTTLRIRVDTLEKQLPKEGTVTIPQDEYLQLKAKIINALGRWDLIVALIKKSFKK